MICRKRFLPRDAVLVWYVLLRAVRLSGCLPHAGIVSKQLNGSSIYSAQRFSAYPTLCLVVKWFALTGGSSEAHRVESGVRFLGGTTSPLPTR